MQPFNAGEVYVNSLDEGEGHRVREAYGINYARLVMLKTNSIPPISSPAITISLPSSIFEAGTQRRIAFRGEADISLRPHVRHGTTSSSRCSAARPRRRS